MNNDAIDLFLYNTLSREKERFLPINDPIKLYTCGPTVYGYAHIGNFRTYVFEDLLKRVLLFLGYSVYHVMNITDVDDKTLAGARNQGCSLEKYCQPYIDAFFTDLEALRILKADAYPHATHYIPQMIKAIQQLIDQGVAYIGQDQSVYFSINQFPNYGALSHLNLEELRQSARVDADEYDKDNLCDFVLWKAYDRDRDGEIFWESPFGKGRPGWHLECSVMSMSLLGQSLDIHAGGVDNIFPHHENEIAQSESLSHKPFVRYWLHSHHLLVDGKKMSKSLGNFLTLRDLLNQGFSGEEIRYLLLQGHYRTQLNFTQEGLQASRQSLKRLRDFISRLEDPSYPNDIIHPEVSAICQNFLDDFVASITNDLNISISLAALFDFIRKINSIIDSQSAIQKEAASIFSQQDAQHILSLLRRIDQVLAVLPFAQEAIPEDVLQLVKEREAARKIKNWQEADRLRDEILSLGFAIEDGKTGIKVKKL
ncbi:cysteine--tRNA ligase [Chlamydia sp.]|uniref:cysteine--tRNA ligase n=1 Tax=Chlamydia sp. TaxID=35827 RepID=UPI0025C13414|nr:cysteine--tRNA ligase [Chlamydia sp.]MBQ8498572.1 cysteine--tRNA ligase [Chlamydia sp.]